MIENFTKVSRPHGECWLHNSRPVWIVEYSGTRVRGPFFQAYKAVEKVPAGRDPWTVDNRRIGTEDGFQTLQEAAEAT